MKGSEEVLAPPNVQVGVSGFSGFFKGLIALPSLIGVQKNPDGATLHDVLPADVYARWTTVKAKYVGDDDGIERLRPIFVAERLKTIGFEKNGLTGTNEIFDRIIKIASDNKVKVTNTGVSKQLDDPRTLVRDFKQAKLEDLACFTKTLDTLDADITATRQRANAWANGNIAEINRLDYADREAACGTALLNNAAVKKIPGFEHLEQEARDNWLAAAEKALAANAHTFAMLHMKNIVGPDGALAALQARGYTVESPRN